MTSTIIVSAPAKINLTLDVFPPRPDGFHDLDSVVVKLSPADTLTMTITSGGGGTVHLTCDEPSLPTDDRNLVVRAAKAAIAVAGADITLTIHLNKRLPMEAGLGGGSSDAAATLRGLAELLNLSSENVYSLAATLGSDIPLFLTPGAVRMQGRGEKITPIAPTPSLFGVLVRPSVGVPTGPAYRLLDELPQRIPGATTEPMVECLEREASLDEIAYAMHNDFESAILPAFPAIVNAHSALTSAGAIRTLLSGSGSALFGLAKDRAHARELCQKLTGMFPFVTETETWNE